VDGLSNSYKEISVKETRFSGKSLVSALFLEFQPKKLFSMAFCLFPPKAKVVVAVVAIGHDELYKITLPTIEKWCQLHGYLLEIISTCEPYSSPFWAKFKAYDFFEKHNANCVLMLDADILIKPGSPSPVDLKPRTGVYAANSITINRGMAKVSRDQQERFIDLYHKATGILLPSTDFYINGGVCVVWRDAKDFLAPPLHESLVMTGADGAYDDQNLMNARCFGRYTELPSAYNFEHPYIPDNLRRMKDCDIWFLHLNAPGDKLPFAREIMSWPCFAKAEKQWWLKYRLTALAWSAACVGLFRVRKSLNSKIKKLIGLFQNCAAAGSKKVKP
jgi:lipopolysaccharide biosynthesis glycosyltransferase